MKINIPGTTLLIGTKFIMNAIKFEIPVSHNILSIMAKQIHHTSQDRILNRSGQVLSSISLILVSIRLSNYYTVGLKGIIG